MLLSNKQFVFGF